MRHLENDEAVFYVLSIKDMSTGEIVSASGFGALPFRIIGKRRTI
jgi:hypothetical protein